MSKILSNKTALVTGGSRGIGAAIVKRLAQEGAVVAFSYSASPNRASEVINEVEARGGRAIAFQADQASSTEVAALVKDAHEALGGLDILVNSAAVFITGVVGDPDADIAAFDRQLAINVGGVVTAVRTAAPLLNDGGRIISLGATSATAIPFPGIADYAGTKAAIAAYTRGWSRDLGPRNITVNIIQPGSINTDMNPEHGRAFSDTIRHMTALGRYGRPEEIAGVVSFLAGPDASFITGATLNIDGGFGA